MPGSRVQQALRSVLEPVLAGAGYDLESVSLSAAGKRSVLRVVVDRDGGIDLDAVAEATRLAGAALDAADPLPGTYLLEVTSPGVDRLLSEPRHWRRARGRLVQASLRDGGRVAGRVRDADEASVTLLVDGTERRFGYDELGRGRVQVEFAATGD